MQPDIHPLRPSFFFFNDTATTEIYTLSLHDALPISLAHRAQEDVLTLAGVVAGDGGEVELAHPPDRKSTRLNSSHMSISYAVFCLKKKKKKQNRYNSQKHNTTNHKHQKQR